MQSHATPAEPAARRHRPKTLTVFAAAFAAGAVLAYGVNRVVDVHVVQVEPQVESEPIFVALRALPQGSPITVWDVALKDWPKALLPAAALKADTTFEGLVLRHPVREGQPLLSVQLARDEALLSGSTIAALPAAPPPAPVEQFRPAAPAEPQTTAAATVAPPTPADTVVPAVTAMPAAAPMQVVAEPTPAAADLVAVVPVREEPAPVAEPAPAAVTETAPQADAWQIAAAAATTSPDIDAPVAATTVAEPTPVPTPVDVPTEVVAAVRPLAAPVPALPSTDLERSLADVGRGRTAPAEQPASVLDRTTSAEPPAAVQTAPKQHLVVPERIALAVDASFTQQREQPATGVQPQAQQQPLQQQRTMTAPSRGTTPPAASAQARAGGRKSAATPPTARKQQPTSRQPAARQQPTPPRGLSAWLPQFSAGRKAAESTTGKTERR